MNRSTSVLKFEYNLALAKDPPIVGRSFACTLVVTRLEFYSSSFFSGSPVISSAQDWFSGCGDPSPPTGGYGLLFGRVVVAVDN